MNIHPFMFLSAIMFFSTVCEAQNIALNPVICQNKKCYPANAALTREKLFESVQSLIKNNVNQQILLCEANAQSKMCLSKGFSLPLQSNLFQTQMEILSAKITDAKDIEKTTGSDLIVDYKVKAGNIFPNCQTAPSRLGVLENNQIQIIAPEFSCRFGQSIKTSLSLVYNVDYVNFDNGSIGAYYSISADNKLMGQKTGYLLFRFSQPAQNLSSLEFPMPEVFNQYQQQLKQQAGNGYLAPVWLKPTPILNVETPQVTTGADGSLIIQDTPATPSGTIQNVPTTTGLITQDKVILPPTQGARKTITVKKQIFQEGKPVAYEEDVKRYVQENENAPFIEEEKLIQKQKENTLLVPDMPKPSKALIETNLPTTIPEFIFPHEVTLTQAEIGQIQKQAPQLTKTTSPHNIKKQDKTADANEPSLLNKVWGKVERFFYF